MKLKDKDYKKAKYGLPASSREWWDIGDGYEIYVYIGKDICSIGISAPDEQSLTYDVASVLGVDVSEKSLVKRHHDGEELYVSMGIDCAVLNYRKPANYKQLLEKIEVIINEKFKIK